MAPLNRFEIYGSELIEADKKVALQFEKVGWGTFFRCFNGHHVEVTKMFAMNLNDDVVQIGNFTFVINEDKIAEETKLPQVRERCIKGSKVNKKKCLSLLLPLPDNTKLKIGVPVRFMKPEWKAYYEILVRYVSYDGRFSHLHYYHLRLLLALQGCRLNLPFYLWQSLKKMSQAVRSFNNPDRSLFHHRLIKIIVQHQLSVNGKSWDGFLTDCHLGPMQYWPNPSPKI